MRMETGPVATRMATNLTTSLQSPARPLQLATWIWEKLTTFSNANESAVVENMSTELCHYYVY